MSNRKNGIKVKLTSNILPQDWNESQRQIAARDAELEEALQDAQTLAENLSGAMRDIKLVRQYHPEFFEGQMEDSPRWKEAQELASKYLPTQGE